mmetsp:Transcript_1779/g.4187  ORF Transcript_1779/g.4187 Transcript_1779/m.4187 type:complete len:228 (-) Transcript_1779:11-694(-)
MMSRKSVLRRVGEHAVGVVVLAHVDSQIRVHDTLGDDGAFRARPRHETPLGGGRGRESGRVDKVAKAVVGPACVVREVTAARVGRAWLARRESERQGVEVAGRHHCLPLSARRVRVSQTPRYRVRCSRRKSLSESRVGVVSRGSHEERVLREVVRLCRETLRSDPILLEGAVEGDTCPGRGRRRERGRHCHDPSRGVGSHDPRDTPDSHHASQEPIEEGGRGGAERE